MQTNTHKKIKVVIAGASGFIGKKLISYLCSFENKYEVIALSRSAGIRPPSPSVRWRTCDLFSLLQVENALKDADVAVYLVHSMLPTDKLSQGSFEDFDLILADNFARAAKKNNIKQIIYLGGIIPPVKKLSAHLMSRLEVEKQLQNYNIPVTCLRAGLIIGPNGSSFEIIRKLVLRLPVMLCPTWTQTKSSPIDVRDVIQIIEKCILNSDHLDKVYDIAGNDIITYLDLMKLTAKKMKKNRVFYKINFFSPKLSKLWVSLFSSTSRALVYPLIESLKHEMTAEMPKIFPDHTSTYSLDQSIDHALVTTEKSYTTGVSSQSDLKVRSVQRMKISKKWDALSSAEEYMRWLKKTFTFLVVIKKTENQFRFCLLGYFDLLVFRYSVERSTTDRALFYIEGGWLVKYQEKLKSRLEFRCVLDGNDLIVAIHDYIPALPWYVYTQTQARLHLLVMKAFSLHLKK